MPLIKSYLIENYTFKCNTNVMHYLVLMLIFMNFFYKENKNLIRSRKQSKVKILLTNYISNIIRYYFNQNNYLL